jgi:hypothetical protein
MIIKSTTKHNRIMIIINLLTNLCLFWIFKLRVKKRQFPKTTFNKFLLPKTNNPNKNQNTASQLLNKSLTKIITKT